MGHMTLVSSANFNISPDIFRCHLYILETNKVLIQNPVVHHFPQKAEEDDSGSETEMEEAAIEEKLLHYMQ